jgi:hypothetical protein
MEFAKVETNSQGRNVVVDVVDVVISDQPVKTLEENIRESVQVLRSLPGARLPADIIESVVALGPEVVVALLILDQSEATEQN